MAVTSHSRALTDRAIASFGASARVIVRDLAKSLPHVDEAWVTANYTPDEVRTPEQREILALSDTLIDQVLAADVLVIGLPVYNFGVPASLKAWIDLVCRARRTFRFTESGPVGLVCRKKAIVVYVSSGTPMGSAIDCASGHLKLVLNFVGITDVRFIEAGMHLTSSDRLVTAGEMADRIGAKVEGAEAMLE